MARELRIGDRVRTPQGDGILSDCESHAGTWRVVYPEGHGRQWYPQYITPLPADIPRERVADLHAAVVKRLAQLDSNGTLAGDAETLFAWRELATFAETLRLLLEVDDGE